VKRPAVKILDKIDGRAISGKVCSSRGNDAWVWTPSENSTR
jgi:hypothetical protein